MRYNNYQIKNKNVQRIDAITLLSQVLFYDFVSKILNVLNIGNVLMNVINGNIEIDKEFR